MREVKFLERLAENLLEGGFSLALKPKLQPVQIAKALAREMENSQVVGANSLLVANRYEAFLHPDDFAVVAPYRASVERELAGYLKDYANRRDLKPISTPTVRLLPAEGPGRRGRVQVAAQMIDAEPDAVVPSHVEERPPFEGTVEMPVVASRKPSKTVSRPPACLVDENGQSFELPSDHIRMGRAMDNDLVLESARVSRHHARISWESGRYVLIDLDSTNGSFASGHKITRHTLTDGEEILLGGARLTFRLVDHPK